MCIYFRWDAYFTVGNAIDDAQGSGLNEGKDMKIAVNNVMKLEPAFEGGMEMIFKVNETKSIYDLKNNPLGICIHKYTGCGDNLYLTCYKLNIWDRDLYTEDIVEAVKKSQGIVSEVLRDITLNAKAFILDDSDIEYTDW